MQIAPLCRRIDPAGIVGAPFILDPYRASSIDPHRPTTLSSKLFFAVLMIGPLPTTRYPDSVFISGDTDTGACRPWALALPFPHNTCSPVTTCNRITVLDMESLLMSPGDPERQRFLRDNRAPFAFASSALEIDNNTFDLQPIPISLEEVALDMEMKVFHCPVDTFNYGRLKDLPVSVAWITTAQPTAHQVACQAHLYRGSSGGPFISRTGGAVGILLAPLKTLTQQLSLPGTRQMPQTSQRL